MQKSNIKNLPPKAGKCGKISKIGIIILILVLFSVGCQKKEAKKAEGPPVIPVKVMKVESRDLAESLDYVGSIKAQDEVVVYPKVSGKISQKVKEDGAKVDKGEAIAFIDRDEVGLKFQKAPVESPLTGIVGRIYVDIGANVLPQTPIALVVDMDKVKINLDIPEKYLPRISLGQEAKVSVDAYPEKQFSGRITKISPVVDLATRTAPVEITIDNNEHLLKSGMFAKVSLIIQQYKNVPVILKEAMVSKEPEVSVYVVENNRAHLKNIKLGIRQGPYLAVTEGLTSGDLVVIMGQQRLRDNAAVSLEIEPESRAEK